LYKFFAMLSKLLPIALIMVIPVNSNASEVLSNSDSPYFKYKRSTSNIKIGGLMLSSDNESIRQSENNNEQNNNIGKSRKKPTCLYKCSDILNELMYRDLLPVAHYTRSNNKTKKNKIKKFSNYEEINEDLTMIESFKKSSETKNRINENKTKSKTINDSIDIYDNSNILNNQQDDNNISVLIDTHQEESIDNKEDKNNGPKNNNNINTCINIDLSPHKTKQCIKFIRSKRNRASKTKYKRAPKDALDLVLKKEQYNAKVRNSKKKNYKNFIQNKNSNLDLNNTDIYMQSVTNKEPIDTSLNRKYIIDLSSIQKKKNQSEEIMETLKKISENTNNAYKTPDDKPITQYNHGSSEYYIAKQSKYYSNNDISINGRKIIFDNENHDNNILQDKSKQILEQSNINTQHIKNYNINLNIDNDKNTYNTSENNTDKTLENNNSINNLSTINETNNKPMHFLIDLSKKNKNKRSNKKNNGIEFLINAVMKGNKDKIIKQEITIELLGDNMKKNNKQDNQEKHENDILLNKVKDNNSTPSPICNKLNYFSTMYKTPTDQGQTGNIDTANIAKNLSKIFNIIKK